MPAELKYTHIYKVFIEGAKLLPLNLLLHFNKISLSAEANFVDHLCIS